MNFPQHRGDIQIGVDCTDHIAFLCPSCDAAMTCIGVKTERVCVDTVSEKTDKCTWIYLACAKCNLAGQRKFYWTVTDPRDCDWRTDDRERLGAPGAPEGGAPHEC